MSHSPPRVALAALLGLALAATLTAAAPLYLSAAALTLPTSVMIYPALRVNVFATSAVGSALDLDLNRIDALQGAGVFVIFAAAALVNGVLARSAWHTR